jgi:hypothetical protein
MTGESLAVDKYVADVIYYTTGCKRGKAYAIVTHSAKMSFVGRTASLVSGAKDQGHFKAIMNSIGTSLLVIVVGWILAAWMGGFFHHLKIATPEGNSNNLLHYALILLIVGVPVGLPVVTTTTLAVGAAYLAKEKAIVQKLTAIESLAVSNSALFSRVGGRPVVCGPVPPTCIRFASYYPAPIFGGPEYPFSQSRASNSSSVREPHARRASQSIELGLGGAVAAHAIITLLGMNRARSLCSR